MLARLKELNYSGDALCRFLKGCMRAQTSLDAEQLTVVKTTFASNSVMNTDQTARVGLFAACLAHRDLVGAAQILVGPLRRTARI